MPKRQGLKVKMKDPEGGLCEASVEGSLFSCFLIVLTEIRRWVFS